MAVLASLLLAAQLYQLGERVVWVGKFAELGTEPFLLDYSTGRFVRATDAELATIRDAKPVAVRTETVAFQKLAGKLTLPPGKGPHHAIVLIHGSNDQDRDALDPWVGFFASQGLAVLSYDKRADWKRSDFHDLAGDTLAGVRLLRQRKDIDGKRIGLFGISQGGWIAPIVASRDRGIAFIILHAGSGLRVADNGLLYVDATLRGYGFPDDEIAQAMAYYRLNDEVTRNPERFKELQEAFQKAKARNVEWLLEDPQPVDFWFRTFYRGIMDFDPAPYWAKVRCPVLAFLGELDHNVPPGPNRAALAAAVKHATIVVLPKANHLFLQAETGLATEYPKLDRFVGGYFDVMAAWLASLERRRPGG